MENSFNQLLWGVSDPNWGNPIVIPETIRAGQTAAEDAFLSMSSYGMYHGGSMHPYPDGTKGKMEPARKQGFKLVRIKINSSVVEIVG